MEGFKYKRKVGGAEWNSKRMRRGINPYAQYRGLLINSKKIYMIVKYMQRSTT